MFEVGIECREILEDQLPAMARRDGKRPLGWHNRPWIVPGGKSLGAMLGLCS